MLHASRKAMYRPNKLRHVAAICAVALVFLAGGYLYQLSTISINGDFSHLGISADRPVLVYSRTDCSACSALKTLLAQQDFAVRYIELDQHPSQADLRNFSALGNQQVPLLITRKTLIVGFHQHATLLALKDI